MTSLKTKNTKMRVLFSDMVSKIGTLDKASELTRAKTERKVVRIRNEFFSFSFLSFEYSIL